MKRQFITVTISQADEYYAVGYSTPNGKPVLLSGMIFYRRSQAREMAEYLSTVGIPYRVFVVKK